MKLKLNKKYSESLNITEYTDAMESYIPSIRDLLNQLNADEDKFAPAEWFEEQSDTELTDAEFIKSRLDNGGRLFLAFVNDNLVGLIHTTLSNFKDTIFMGSFVIDTEHRGNGYGSELMQQFVKLIKKEYKAIALSVHTENKAAKHIYNKAGLTTFMDVMYGKIK